MFEKIRALWKVKELVDWIKSNYSKEVKVMDEIKPGYKTSEFWLTLVSNLITVVGALKGMIPADTAAIVLVVLNSIYSILRTLTKQPDITTIVQK